MSPAKPRVTCKAHCASCGRHFSGTSAFDLHRTGDYGSNDPETRRRCVSPLDLDPSRLEVLSENGWCEISGEHNYDDAKGYDVPRVLHPVTVWSQAISDANRARLASLSKHEAVSQDPDPSRDLDPSYGARTVEPCIHCGEVHADAEDADDCADRAMRLG